MKFTLTLFKYAVVLAIVLLTSGDCLAVQGAFETEASATDDWNSSEFWHSLNGKPLELSWDFVDGEVRLSRPYSGTGNIVTPPLDRSFELSFQWKIAEKTNSGLKYRVRQFDQFRNQKNAWLGVEYQIIDEPPGKGHRYSAASMYGLFAPKKEKSIHPPGQWNSARIVCQGDRIEHYLNGELVTEASTSSVEWKSKLLQSKFFANEDFGQPADGDRVMLTDHGGVVAYRKFAYRPIVESETMVAVESAGPFLGNGMRNGWASHNSVNLWTRTTNQTEINLTGPRFKRFAPEDFVEWRKSKDEARLNFFQLPDQKAASLPEGLIGLRDMYGAMPGAVGEVRLIYFPTANHGKKKFTEWVQTTDRHDFTAFWKLENLQPGCQYSVVVEARRVGSKELSDVLRADFKTVPAPEDLRPIKFCLTTCHDFPRRDDGNKGHKIYPAMSQFAPDFVIHAGDIVYYDKPGPFAMTESLMRFKWQRIFALPNNRKFYQHTTSYFLKDDHDTLKNDCWPGQTYGSVSFKRGLEIFEEQFPPVDKPYQTVRWGKSTQVWLLEGREFRSPNKMDDGPEKTILGANQKEWLFKTLAESDADFKLIVSPTPIVGPDRDNKHDNHANDSFAVEGEELRTRLREIDNVILFCGDRHWQYASKDESGLWEFGCGPGSEKHQIGWVKGDRRESHEFLRTAGGYLTGEVSYSEAEDDEPAKATLRIEHRTVDGESVSEFVFPMLDRTE